MQAVGGSYSCSTMIRIAVCDVHMPSSLRSGVLHEDWKAMSMRDCSHAESWQSGSGPDMFNSAVSEMPSLHTIPLQTLRHIAVVSHEPPL